MAQNTNSAAYLRLKPLENTNIGGIVQEHIRYWNKTKSEEEARALAEKARQQEFDRKKAEVEGKAFDDNLAKMKLEDSQGYFRHNIVESFNSDIPYFTELGEKASKGDNNAKIELAQGLSEYKQVTSLDKLLQAKATALTENAKDFNKVLDKPTLDFLKSLENNEYYFDNRKIVMPNETLSIAEMTSKLNGLQFSGNYSYAESGKKIADAITQASSNGNIQRTPNNAREGTLLWKSELDNNPILLKTEALKAGFTSPTELDEVQKNQLAQNLYKTYSEPSLKQVDNSLANAAKNSTLATQALTRRKTGLEIDKLENATPETGITGVATPTKETYMGYIELNPKVLAKGGKSNINVKEVNSVSVSNAETIPLVKTEEYRNEKGEYIKGKNIDNFTPSSYTRDRYNRMVVSGSHVVVKSISEKVDASDDTKEPSNAQTQVIPEQRERVVVIVPKDQEGIFAKAGNMTLDELNSNISKKAGILD